MEELLVRPAYTPAAETVSWRAGQVYPILLLSLFNRYGQLSGMVEPLAGLFGTAAVVVGWPHGTLFQ